VRITFLGLVVVVLAAVVVLYVVGKYRSNPGQEEGPNGQPL